MSKDESGLGRNAHIAIGALAMFGVAILVVTFNATRGPGVEDTGSLDSDYEAFPAYPGYVPGGCWDAGFYREISKPRNRPAAPEDRQPRLPSAD
jgi:hypothetical protein